MQDQNKGYREEVEINFVEKENRFSMLEAKPV